MDERTPRKVENLVDAIFASRVADGQLDFCPLTFEDITRIRETLLSMLSGMHHFRVKYPGQEEAERGDAERLDGGDRPETEKRELAAEISTAVALKEPGEVEKAAEESGATQKLDLPETE